MINEIKARIAFKAAYEEAGGDLDRTGRGACIMHGGKNKTAFSIKDDRGYCFSCGFSGDVIDLYAKLHGLDTRGAIKYLADRAGIRPGKPNPALTKARRERTEKEKLVKALKAWTKEQRDEIAFILRATKIKFSYEEAQKLGGEFFDGLSYIEDVYENILCKNDRAAHLKLYKTEMGI